MFKKHLECLLAWGDFLVLIIVEVYKMNKWDTKILTFHYVKVQIIIVHNHAILKVLNIKSLKKRNKEKKKLLYYIRSGFEYFIFIRLFQMVSHIFMIYLKHYHIIIILKTNNFTTIFNIKIWKIKHWLHLLWFLWMWLQPMLYWIYKCSTLRVRQRFPSKPNFCNFLNFQQQNPLKIHYLPFFSYENCEIKSIKFDSPRDFQQHQEHCQIPIFFLVFIEKMFQ
jgi:hypothetical protein